jgi:hypothetical protein
MQDLCAMSLKEIFPQDLCERSLGLGLLARSLCILLVKISAQDLLDGISTVPQQERSDTHITKVGQTLKNPRTTRRQRCCKFPATFVKTAFFMRLSRLYATFGLRVSCVPYIYPQEVRNMFVRRKNIIFSTFSFSCLLHIFFWPFSLLSQKNKTR